MLKMLIQNIYARARSCDGPMKKTDAVEFLREKGDLPRTVARNILESFNADTYPEEGRWTLRPIPGHKGRAIGVFQRVEEYGGTKDVSKNPNDDAGFAEDLFCRTDDRRAAENRPPGTRENTGSAEGAFYAAGKRHTQNPEYWDTVDTSFDTPLSKEEGPC